MYNVSQAYLTALSLPAKVRRLTGTIGNPSLGVSYNFDDSNVVSNTFRVFNQCSGDAEISIGSVYMGQLEAVFLGLDALDGMWRGLTITVSEGLLIGYDANNDPIWEDVPLGVFDIFEANHAEDGVHVTAYDNMYFLDEYAWIWDQWTGTAWDFFQRMEEYTGIQLAQTQQEIQTMPNGTVGFTLYAEHGMDSWRDALHWMSQALGCFATFDRTGKLKLIQYKNAVDYPELIDVTIGKSTRWRGATIADFNSYYEVMTFDNVIDGVVWSTDAGTTTSRHLTYELGANPFLQYFDTTEPLWNIFSAIINIDYTPFSVDMAAAPYLDLGDCVQFTDFREGWSPIGCVMSYSYQFHGTYTIEGFGSNPALVNVRTGVDKEFAAMSARTNANEIQYYTFTNGEGIEIGTSYQDIIDIRFGSINKAMVVFQAEIKMYLSADAELTVKYVYNDEEIEYHPQDIKHEGHNLLHLLYYYKTTGGELNRLRVYVKLSNGAGSIEVGDIQACVWGQGLVATDKWDGWIEAEDNIVAIDFSITPGAIDAFVERLEIMLPEAVVIDLTDHIGEVVFATTPANVIRINEGLYINKKALSELTWQQVYDLPGGWQELYDDYLW